MLSIKEGLYFASPFFVRLPQDFPKTLQECDQATYKLRRIAQIEWRLLFHFADTLRIGTHILLY